MIQKKYFNNRSVLVTLIAILLISLVVRVLGVYTEDIWPDEGLTLHNANKPLIENIKWSLSLAYFPLYHMVLSWWVKIFGLGELSARSLSIVFGVLSVYMAYRIGNLMFNKKVGIYSAIILGVSPFNVFYSQEVRVYSLFVFLSLCSIYYYIEYIGKKRIYICSITSYSHY